MIAKQKGKCPFCDKSVQALVEEENVIRRDRCKCPECGETIYLCRTPGCHDYAKGTKVYDHELCPSCTSTVSETTSSVASTAGKAAVVIVGAVASAAAKSHFDKK